MKRLLAMLLVLVMVFSLVACGKPADKTDDTKPAGNTTPKETKPTVEAPKKRFGKKKESKEEEGK